MGKEVYMAHVVKKLSIPLGTIAFIILMIIFSLDMIIKNQIEKYGSEIFGAKVKVSSVHAIRLSGYLSVNGIDIANPEGFSTPSAFKVGSITLNVEKGSIFSDRLVLARVLVVEPRITSELSFKGSNIAILKRNINSYDAKP